MDEKKMFEMPQFEICKMTVEDATVTSYLCCTDGVDKNGSSCCEVA